MSLCRYFLSFCCHFVSSQSCICFHHCFVFFFSLFRGFVSLFSPFTFLSLFGIPVVLLCLFAVILQINQNSQVLLIGKKKKTALELQYLAHAGGESLPPPHSLLP